MLRESRKLKDENARHQLLYYQVQVLGLLNFKFLEPDHISPRFLDEYCTLHREQTNYIILQPDEEDSSCLRLLARMLRVSLLSVLSCLMNKNKQENNDNTIGCDTWHTSLNTSLISISNYLIHLLLQSGKMGNLHILHTYAKNT